MKGGVVSVDLVNVGGDLRAATSLEIGLDEVEEELLATGGSVAPGDASMCAVESWSRLEAFDFDVFDALVFSIHSVGGLSKVCKLRKKTKE